MRSIGSRVRRRTCRLIWRRDTINIAGSGAPRECLLCRYLLFLALLNARDLDYHAKARAANRIRRDILTSQWVLIELADHLCDRQNRHLFAAVLDALHQDPRYTIVPAEQVLLDAATRIYIDRGDKDWSLTDCTSILIMQQRELNDVLTADHHFEQAGFTALLK